MLLLCLCLSWTDAFLIILRVQEDHWKERWSQERRFLFTSRHWTTTTEQPIFVLHELPNSKRVQSHIWVENMCYLLLHKHFTT